MFGRSVRLVMVLLCVATVLAIAGCGDDGESSGRDAPQVSAAGEPSKVFIKRLVKLIETTDKKADCQQLETINSRSYVRFACPPAKDLRTSMKDFKLVGAGEYGTGGVIDYQSGAAPDGAAIVLFVTPDNNWGIGRFGVVTKPSTKTNDDETREGFEQAVSDYFAAVRARDCAAFREVVFIGDDSTPTEICKDEFAATKDLAKRMKRNPSAKPRYEGGNAAYGFLTFDTVKPDESSTISVLKAGVGANESYKILDVTPGPTRIARDAIRRRIEEQLKRPSTNPNDMAPSSKPSEPALKQ